MGKHTPTRREFLKTTSAVTGAVAVPYVIASTALGAADRPAASERIVMGGIGIGNMGHYDQGGFLRRKDVQYVAVCDVRKGVRDVAKRKVDDKYGNKDCAAYTDFRDMMARDDIDAVHIATPDHWHAIMVIEACRAGKDAFCQKPETRTLREGGLMVETARRYGRVVAGGSQRVRSDYDNVVEKCWAGEFGKIKAINVNVGPLSQLCNLPGEPVPKGMDWDLWLGPALWAPYNSKRCDGNFGTGGGSWRSYIDYSGGGMTDWGAHHFGGATFAVDVRELQPEEVNYCEDGGKKYVEFRYPNGILVTHNKPGKGNLQVDGSDEAKEAKATPQYKGTAALPIAIDAFRGDFIECVKTREKPFRDIELAVNTAMLCHMATIAYTVERSLKWDTAKQEFIDDAEANRFLDRARREPWQL